MTRSEFIRELASRCQLTHNMSEEVVKIILDTIVLSLANNDRVELRDFGVFSVRIRSMRQSRNPKTGEPVSVPEKRVPFFNAGKEMRVRVNHGPLQKKDADA